MTSLCFVKHFNVIFKMFFLWLLLLVYCPYTLD